MSSHMDDLGSVFFIFEKCHTENAPFTEIREIRIDNRQKLCYNIILIDFTLF